MNKELKYLKRFNETKGSSSELEDKLRTIIDSIESYNWNRIDNKYFSGHQDQEVENIKFKEVKTKLNKLCYELNSLELIYTARAKKIDSGKKDKLFDFQITYDNRGIVVMSGLSNNNPKILNIFNKDMSVEDIELEIVRQINTNIIKYSESTHTSSNQEHGYNFKSGYVPNSDGTTHGNLDTLRSIDKLSKSDLEDLQRRNPNLYREYDEIKNDRKFFGTKTRNLFGF